jgi:hypothetical protein
MNIFELITKGDFDLQESIVEVEGEAMMLIEFIEANEFQGHEILGIVAGLINTGVYHVCTGNGTSEPVTLRRWEALSNRED